MIQYKGEVIIPIGRLHFLVESWTEPGEHHAVDMEEISCSCRGYQCTGSCRHLLVLQDFIEEEPHYGKEDCRTSETGL